MPEPSKITHTLEQFKLEATKVLWHRYMLNLNEFASEGEIEAAFKEDETVDLFVDHIGRHCSRVDTDWGPHQNKTVEEAWASRFGPADVAQAEGRVNREARPIEVNFVEKSGDPGPEPPLPEGVARYGDVNIDGKSLRGDRKRVRKGLYLCLFHGRLDPKAELDNWGHNGPMIGPLTYCQITYASEIKLEFKDEKAAEFFKGKFEELSVWGETEADGIPFVDDLVKLGGYYYGDLTVANF